MILLDMDGVLCDFVGSAARLFGKNPSYVYANWKGDHDACPAEIGVSPEKLWEKIEAEGEAFWTGLEPYPWAKEMYEWLVSKDDVVILTKPNYHPSCVAGKLAWLYSFTDNPRFGNYLIGPRKDACARPSSLLIDDNDANVESFVKAGGRALLFPQPWNKERAFKGDKFTNLRYQMQTSQAQSLAP